MQKIINFFKRLMTKVHVNGVVYQGRTITVYGNRIIVDGIDRTPDTLKVDIHVEGNLDSLQVDCANKVSVAGSAKTVKTTSGDVLVEGGVTGSVQTSSGDVQINGDVSGNIQTMSGDVEAWKVAGGVKTVSGDVKGIK